MTTENADAPPRWTFLVQALNRKGALHRCPACTQDVTVQVLSGNDATRSYVAVDGPPPPSIKSLESIKVACTNCGFVREHLIQFAEGPGVVAS